MYEFSRKIHYYSGLAILTFVVMYFLTGYLMIRHSLMPRSEPVKNTVVESLDHNHPEMSSQEFSVYLQERFNLRGKRNVPTKPRQDGSWKFSYYHPGTESVAVVSSEGNEVEITKTKQGANGVIVGFHRLHGYGGGWLYNIWAFMYDLASLALILFPISGFVVWYRNSRNKLAGWFVLASGFSLTTMVLLYIMYA